MILSDYKNLINKATTKEELQRISYQALLDSKKIWDKVIDLCLKREEVLGLL